MSEETFGKSFIVLCILGVLIMGAISVDILPWKTKPILNFHYHDCVKINPNHFYGNLQCIYFVVNSNGFNYFEIHTNGLYCPYPLVIEGKNLIKVDCPKE